MEIILEKDNVVWNDAPCEALRHFICEYPIGK
jgi:hypothetical protein